MALARIITRSQACSRELALDLLSRGYTVEIVSPDRIPDNLADLELRVDAGPGDQLIASVEAHDGRRSASLDFVHHLKAPMADFVRRPLYPAEGVQISVNAAHGIEPTELLAEAPQSGSKNVSPAAAKILRDPKTDVKDGTGLISPQDRLPQVPIKPPTRSVIASASVQAPTTVRPRGQVRQRSRTAGGFWSACFTFASIVLLAFLLWVGIRQTGKAAQLSGGARAEKLVSASSAVNSSSAGDRARDWKNQNKSIANPGATAAGTAASSVGNNISPKHGGDFVAHDTVIYLDKRAADEAATRANLAKRLTGRDRISNKSRGGVIAANSVTYFTNKPTAKAARQDSAIISGSDTK